MSQSAHLGEHVLPTLDELLCAHCPDMQYYCLARCRRLRKISRRYVLERYEISSSSRLLAEYSQQAVETCHFLRTTFHLPQGWSSYHLRDRSDSARAARLAPSHSSVIRSHHHYGSGNRACTNPVLARNHNITWLSDVGSRRMHNVRLSKAYLPGLDLTS